jgi:hypothetical protein
VPYCSDPIVNRPFLSLIKGVRYLFELGEIVLSGYGKYTVDIPYVTLWGPNICEELPDVPV